MHNLTCQNSRQCTVSKTLNDSDARSDVRESAHILLINRKMTKNPECGLILKLETVMRTPTPVKPETHMAVPARMSL